MNIREFIEEVRQHEELYDKSNQLYRNRAHKAEVWEAISQKFNVNAKLRWGVCRDRYVREVNRVNLLAQQNVKGEMEIWRLFPQLCFLENHIKPKKKKENMLTSDEVAFKNTQFKDITADSVCATFSINSTRKRKSSISDQNADIGIDSLFVHTLKQLSDKLDAVTTSAVQRGDDEDYHFLQSLKYTMQRLDEEEKFHFKLFIMQAAHKAEMETGKKLQV